MSFAHEVGSLAFYPVADTGRILCTERDSTKLCQKICDSLSRTCGYVTVWIGRPDFAGNRVDLLAGSENEPNTFLISPNILDNQPTVKGSVGTTDHEHRLMLFDDSAPVPVRAETVAALARLPEGWRNQLRDDLQVADFSRVEEMVKSLQTGHPNPASTLGRLAGRFDAENLLQLLADAAANPSSQPG